MGTEETVERADTNCTTDASKLQMLAQVRQPRFRMNIDKFLGVSASMSQEDGLVDFASPTNSNTLSTNSANVSNTPSSLDEKARQGDVPSQPLLSFWRHQDMPAMSGYPFLPFQQGMLSMQDLLDLAPGNDGIYQATNSPPLPSQFQQHRASMPSIHTTDISAQTTHRKRRYTQENIQLDDSSRSSQNGDADENEEEKRRNFLERNRQAALKCRQRKKQWLVDLQRKVEHLTSDNETLQHQAIVLREEIINLKTVLLAHKECPVAQMNNSTNHDTLRQSHTTQPSLSNYYYARVSNDSTPISSSTSTYSTPKGTLH